MNAFTCSLKDHIQPLRGTPPLHSVEHGADAARLTQHLVLTFALACHVTPNARARRRAILKNFADYFSVFDPQTERQDPRVFPRSRGSLRCAAGTG